MTEKKQGNALSSGFLSQMSLVSEPPRLEPRLIKRKLVSEASQSQETRRSDLLAKKSAGSRFKSRHSNARSGAHVKSLYRLRLAQGYRECSAKAAC